MRDASGCCAEGYEVWGNGIGLVGRGEEFGGAFGLGQGDGIAVEEQLFGLRIVGDEGGLCGWFGVYWSGMEKEEKAKRKDDGKHGKSPSRG